MKYLIIITLSFFLLQCFSSSRSKSRRGKLGDVMEKASDDHKGDRTVTTDEEDNDPFYDEPEEMDADLSTASRVNSDTTKDDSSKTKFNWMLSCRYEFGLNSRDYFRRMNQTALGIGVYGDRVAIGAYVGYGWDVTNENTFIGNAVKSPVSEYLFGFEFHYYTTPDWTFIGHHIFAGFDFGLINWDYKNPVEIEDTRGIIKSDSIERLHLYIGTGINIAQTKFFNLGGYAAFGGRFYDDISGEGFENDQFKTEGFVKLGIILDIGKIR